MHFDDIFDHVGAFGYYQVLLLLVICSMGILASDYVQMNFMGYRVKSWCRVPRLVNFSYSQQLQLAIPDDESCRRFDVDFDRYSDEELLAWNRNYTSDTVPCDNGWVHDQSEFVSTAVTEWDLVCNRGWMVEMVSTVYMGGRLIGSLACGPISDRFGRKPTALGFHAVKILGALVAAFLPYYLGFLIGRGLMAIGTTGSNLATFVLATEICGKRYRATFGNLCNNSISIAACVIPGVAFFVREYIKLQHVFTWPNLVIILFVFCVDESPRWLVSQGRDEEAIVILRKVAAVNRRTLPDNLTFHEERERNKKLQEFVAARNPSITDLFKTRYLRQNSLVTMLSWFTGSLMFYGLSLNSGRLPGDVFMNTFLLSVVEIPANIICIILLDKAGRRPTVGVAMLFGGFLTFLCIPFIIFDHLETAATVLSILGKAFVAVAYMGMYIMTAEMAPTVIRNISLGTASMLARVAGMAAPYVGGPLSDIEPYLPSVVYGCLATLTGILVLAILPETLGVRLPDTLEEAETFSRCESLDGTDKVVANDKERDNPLVNSSQKGILTTPVNESLPANNQNANLSTKRTGSNMEGFRNTSVDIGAEESWL